MKRSFSMILCFQFLLVFNLEAHAGDPRIGEQIFKKCQRCHSVDVEKEGAKHGIGPSLIGIMNKKAASQSGFKGYSPQLLKAGKHGLVWNIANLDAYLKHPKAFMATRAKTCLGLSDDVGRLHVIAYLRTFTKGEEVNISLTRQPDEGKDPKQ